MLLLALAFHWQQKDAHKVQPAPATGNPGFRWTSVRRKNCCLRPHLDAARIPGSPRNSHFGAMSLLKAKDAVDKSKANGETPGKGSSVPLLAPEIEKVSAERGLCCVRVMVRMSKHWTPACEGEGGAKKADELLPIVLDELKAALDKLPLSDVRRNWEGKSHEAVKEMWDSDASFRFGYPELALYQSVCGVGVSVLASSNATTEPYEMSGDKAYERKMCVLLRQPRKTVAGKRVTDEANSHYELMTVKKGGVTVRVFTVADGEYEAAKRQFPELFSPIHVAWHAAEKVWKASAEAAKQQQKSKTEIARLQQEAEAAERAAGSKSGKSSNPKPLQQEAEPAECAAGSNSGSLATQNPRARSQTLTTPTRCLQRFCATSWPRTRRTLSSLRWWRQTCRCTTSWSASVAMPTRESSLCSAGTRVKSLLSCLRCSNRATSVVH